MRDWLVFACVFGTLPFVFKRPAIGIFLFIVISLMNPNRLAYGAAYDFPFAALVAGVTMLALLLKPRPRHLPLGAIGVTLFMALLTMYALDGEADIRALAWVLGLSLAVYGVKGGVFTIATGGSYRVLGPEGSYIEDNNSLALALVMIAPLLWYLHLQARRRWLRLGMSAAALLTLVAAAGSYSRGALLAGGAMLLFLWLKSRDKLRTGLAVLLVVPLIRSE